MERPGPTDPAAPETAAGSALSRRRPHEYRIPTAPKREQIDPEPRREYRKRKTPWGLVAGAAIASLATISLVIAASSLWGPATQPQALGTGSAQQPGASNGPGGPSASNEPTTSPEPVTPGELVPITMNAQFTQGVTLVPPKPGDWSVINIINRPEQFTARSPSYNAEIEVWQAGLNTTPQSDEYLTQAQLNRLSDECGGTPTLQGGPEVVTLTGDDGTRLEMLLQKATDCDGGEIWMYERLMPHSGTRFHIVLWSTLSVEHNAELQAKFNQITFTVP